MRFDDLKLLPGTRMKVVIAGGPTQSALACKFIGSYPPRSLLVSLPATEGDNNAIRVGARVAISLASPTGIVTFSSQIQSLHHEPFAYLHLSYPDALQVRNVRSAVRVSVEVQAQVTNLLAEDHLEMQQARIIDMSVNGMKLASAAPLGAVGDELAVHVQLTLDDIAREIMLTGVIRTCVASDSASEYPYACGLEFTMLDEDKRVLLYAFVFNMVQRYGAQI